MEVSPSLLALSLLCAPPDLPPVEGQNPPPDDGGELEDNPEWDEEDAGDDAREDEGSAVRPPVVAPAPAPSPGSDPQKPSAQRPVRRSVNGGATGSAGTSKTEGPARTPSASHTTAPSAEKDWDGKPRGEEEAAEAAEEEEKKGKFNGLKLFRIAVYPKIGYTHGTSQKNGIFDRQKSIDASIENMEATMKGAGDLGNTQFGGFMGGFEVDLEVFFINAWLDFHKFFRPGGMWSLLIGYDHEFDFHKRVRFNLGAGFGMMRVFLGDALEDLYYDSSNPQAVNIATAGIEGRLMTGFDFRIAGPLWTGPQFMGGYHYLWSANAEEVTKEKGFHYSAAWNLKLHFEFPRDW
jgi:hypothetical protein